MAAKVVKPAWTSRAGVVRLDERWNIRSSMKREYKWLRVHGSGLKPVGLKLKSAHAHLVACRWGVAGRWRSVNPSAGKRPGSGRHRGRAAHLPPEGGLPVVSRLGGRRAQAGFADARRRQPPH